jgi:DNA-binding HxlR family transcriptional regulator
MRRTSLQDDPCPVARSLDAVGDWWSLLIIRNIAQGMRRFGQMQASLGIAKNILSARLKTLVAEGILETRPAEDGSARQEYLLTEKGRDLFPVLVALRQWGEKHLFAHDAPNTVLVDRENGEPVNLVVSAADGRPLQMHDAAVAPAPKKKPVRRSRPRVAEWSY